MASPAESKALQSRRNHLDRGYDCRARKRHLREAARQHTCERDPIDVVRQDASCSYCSSLRKKLETLEALSTSEVTFGELNQETIDAYISSGEPFGKAGAYGIQGVAAAFIRELRGSYSGVMGLPLFETNQLLQICGAKTNPQPLERLGV